MLAEFHKAVAERGILASTLTDNGMEFTTSLSGGKRAPAPSTGSSTNRYISVLTITDRKVTHWRDYLDPVTVFDALGWPSR